MRRLSLNSHALFVLCLGMATISLGCSSSEQSGIHGGSSNTCKTDFDCIQGQTCDPSSGQCKEGVTRDNHLSGTITCPLEDPAAQVGLGDIFVSGAFQGTAMEFSIKVDCLLETDPQYVSVLSADSSRAFLFMLDMPFNFVRAAGSSAMQPYMIPIDGSELVQPEVVLLDADDYTSLAVNAAGTVTITKPAVDPTKPFEWSFDADLQTLSAPATCDKACTSQLDCGAFNAGKVGATAPICALGQCAMFCNEGASDPNCATAGGTCDTGTPLCLRPCP